MSRSRSSGWGDAAAVGPIAFGTALLLAFAWHEYVLDRRPDRTPLVELTLFRSRTFTWSVVLASLAVLMVTAVLFLLPQYVQGVTDANATESGLRLLPLVGGMAAGALPADVAGRRFGIRTVTASGFAVVALALLAGARTGIGTSPGFLLAWTAAMGFGIGLCMATVTSAALGGLGEDQSGVGAAVLQAVNKVGAPFGTAVLGSVLVDAYRRHLDPAALPGLSADAVATARDSIFGGVAVARRAQSPSSVETVRIAFVHGMDAALLVTAGVAAIATVLAVVCLPGGRRVVVGAMPREEEVRIVGSE